MVRFRKFFQREKSPLSLQNTYLYDEKDGEKYSTDYLRRTIDSSAAKNKKDQYPSLEVRIAEAPNTVDLRKSEFEAKNDNLIANHKPSKKLYQKGLGPKKNGSLLRMSSKKIQTQGSFTHSAESRVGNRSSEQTWLPINSGLKDNNSVRPVYSTISPRQNASTFCMESERGNGNSYQTSLQNGSGSVSTDGPLPSNPILTSTQNLNKGPRNTRASGSGTSTAQHGSISTTAPLALQTPTSPVTTSTIQQVTEDSNKQSTNVNDVNAESKLPQPAMRPPLLRFPPFVSSPLAMSSLPALSSYIVQRASIPSTSSTYISSSTIPEIIASIGVNRATKYNKVSNLPVPVRRHNRRKSQPAIAIATASTITTTCERRGNPLNTVLASTPQPPTAFKTSIPPLQQRPENESGEQAAPWLVLAPLTSSIRPDQHLFRSRPQSLTPRASKFKGHIDKDLPSSIPLPPVLELEISELREKKSKRSSLESMFKGPRMC